MPDKIAPFPSDLVYLVAEIEHVKVRARRIGVQRRLEEAEEKFIPLRGVIGKASTPEPEELRRVLATLKEEENDLREEIAARLAVNRAVGPTLGLDAICKEHDLGSFERTLLLVATLSTMGDDIADAVAPACPRGFSSWACAEILWAFMEMDLEARVKSRLTLLPDRPLLRAGLVTLDLGRSAAPQHVCDARVELTSLAFSRIVGVPELDRVADPEEE